MGHGTQIVFVETDHVVPVDIGNVVADYIAWTNTRDVVRVDGDVLRSVGATLHGFGGVCGEDHRLIGHVHDTSVDLVGVLDFEKRRAVELLIRRL